MRWGRVPFVRGVPVRKDALGACAVRSLTLALTPPKIRVLGHFGFSSRVQRSGFKAMKVRH